MVFSSHARVTKTSIAEEGFLDRKIKIKEMNDGVIPAEPVFHDADFIWGRHTSSPLFSAVSEDSFNWSHYIYISESYLCLCDLPITHFFLLNWTSIR